MDFADVLGWREAIEDLEPAGEVAGCHDVTGMRAKLIVAVVVATFDGGIVDFPPEVSRSGA